MGRDGCIGCWDIFMSTSVFIQQVINGLGTGGAYALFALSFSLVFGFLDIINLAQAAILTVGGFVAFVVMTLLGWPLILALPISMLVGAALGVVLEVGVFRPLRRQGRGGMAALVASLGALLAINGIVQVITRTSVYSFPSDVIEPGATTVIGVRVSHFTLTMFIVAGVVSGALIVFLRWTDWGRAMRIVGWREDVAHLLGIPSKLMMIGAFAIAGALAALSGALIGIAFNYVYFRMGYPYLLKGLAAVILGGLGSVPGAIVGGLTIGVVESLSIQLFSASWRDGFTFGLLMILLIVRPSGLLGRRLDSDVL